MPLHESGEMYLETILVLSRTKPNVYSIDVANYMGYSKPSVSRAMGLLRQGQYIIVADDGAITLTEDGKAIAERTYERHEILTRFFEKLGITSDIAENDACKVEHVISEETFAAIKKFSQDN